MADYRIKVTTKDRETCTYNATGENAFAAAVDELERLPITSLENVTGIEITEGTEQQQEEVA